MNRKFIKIISVFIATVGILPIFTLCACTDKNSAQENNSNVTNTEQTDTENDNIENSGGYNTEQTLNSIEQKLIGTWNYYDSDKDLSYSFMSNRQCTCGKYSGKFRQDGEDYDSLFGHYYIIKVDNQADLRFYDFNTNSLYLGHQACYTKTGATRILHDTERIILGEWKSSALFTTYYSFKSDGTFTLIGNNGRTYTEQFFLFGDGTSRRNGHYYIFRFTYSMLDWYIYDDDLNTAKQQTGGVYATRTE